MSADGVQTVIGGAAQHKVGVRMADVSTLANVVIIPVQIGLTDARC